MTHFTLQELRCRHCGAFGIDPSFVDILNQIREDWGRPLVVSSGFRCHLHPQERGKSALGTHTYGTAADLLLPSTQHFPFLQLVFAKHPVISGIGVATNYIHLDIGGRGKKRPLLWTYGG